ASLPDAMPEEDPPPSQPPSARSLADLWQGVIGAVGPPPLSLEGGPGLAAVGTPSAPPGPAVAPAPAPTGAGVEEAYSVHGDVARRGGPFWSLRAAHGVAAAARREEAAPAGVVAQLESAVGRCLDLIADTLGSSRPKDSGVANGAHSDGVILSF
ncbi:unnamed protein product, partial [Prorocentrum cordatum]